MSRRIGSREAWDALVVGARTSATHREPVTGVVRQLTIFRCAEEGLATIGNTCIAGGQAWSSLWRYIGYVVDEDSAPVSKPLPEAVAAAEKIIHDAIEDYEEKLQELADLPHEVFVTLDPADQQPESPAQSIIAELMFMGWAPPVPQEKD